MAYRDDLEQARSRIAKLEDELVDARAETAAVAAKADASVSKPRTKLWIPISAAIVALAVAGALVLVLRTLTAPPPVVSIRWVDELVRAHPVGARVRVRGSLVHGSEKRLRNGDQCAVDFVLEHGGAQLPVHHDDCILPDLFGREPFWVIGEGELEANGTFLANDVLVVFRDEMK